MTSLNGVRIWAALLVLLAVGLGILNEEVINRDGILYVNTAQGFLDGGIRGAMQVYNWPAYSIIFAVISDLSGLSLEASAHLLNTLLMLLLVDSFIRFSQGLLGDTSRPWIAALVILSFPPFDHRLEIYRDWGYLAFSFCAFVPLLNYWQQERGELRDVVVWQLCMFVAMLFRVEAAALIVMLPIGFLFQDRPWPLRLRRFMTSNALMALLTVIVFMLLLTNKLPIGKLSDLRLYTDASVVFGHFLSTAEEIGSHVLNKYTVDDAPLILGGGIAALIGWMFLDNLGGFLFLLMVVGLVRYRFPTTDGYRLVYWILIVVVVTLLVFLATSLIAVSRYGLLGSLLLLTLTVFSVNSFEALRDSGRRVGKLWWWFVLVGLVIGNLANLSFHQDYKSYLRDGGHWLSENVPASTRLITNDQIIKYYAMRKHHQKLDTLDKVARAMEKSNPPYVVALKTKDWNREKVFALMKAEPSIEFHSKYAKEALLIFDVKQSDKQAD
jgi:hypothetical protein